MTQKHKLRSPYTMSKFNGPNAGIKINKLNGRRRTTPIVEKIL